MNNPDDIQKAILNRRLGIVKDFLFKGEWCPASTQNGKLNTKNRDSAINAKHVLYGPLNVEKPGDFWVNIATFWGTTVEAAKDTNCGNCAAFDISPRMEKCQKKIVSDKDGRLGYCWMYDFSCHSARTCRTWVKGGPITKDDVSYEWEKKNK